MSSYNKVNDRLFKKKAINWTEQRIKNQLADIFMSRIYGNDLSYAELCLYYRNKEYLDRAVNICYKSKENKSWDILQKLYQLKIKFTAEIDFFDDVELHEYCSQKLIRISKLIDETIKFCNKYSNEASYIAFNYTEIALNVDEIINNEITFIADDEFDDELKIIYQKIIEILDKAEENILADNNDMSDENKIDILKKLRDFYSSNDYTAIYRSEYFCNPEKQYFYQMQIDNINDVGINIVVGDNLDLCQLAFDADHNGEYDKAIEYYEKAYATGNEPYDLVLYNLAETCEKAGYIDKAVENLELILKIDREREKRNAPYFKYTSYASNRLIDIFIKQNKTEEAKKLAYELIHYNKDEQEIYNTTWLIEAYYKLYLIDNNDMFWQKCLEYYHSLDNEETLPKRIYDFLQTYVKKITISSKNIAELMKLSKRLETYGSEDIKNFIFEKAINMSDNLSYIDYHIRALIDYGIYLSDSLNLNSKYEKALQCCENAQNCMKENDIQNDYYQNLIYKVMIKCMSEMGVYSFDQIETIRKKCDYILLVETESPQLTEEENYEAWLDAAYSYGYIDDYANQLYCLKKALPLIEPIYSNFENYWSLYFKIIDCYIHLANINEVKRSLYFIYCKTLEIYGQDDQFVLNLEFKVKDLAEYFERISCCEESFNLYFFAIYLSITPQINISLIMNIKMDKSLEEEFFKTLEISFKNDIGTDKIDFIIEINERIQKLNIINECTKKYISLLKWFSNEYQFNEIEWRI